ncbi:unnamed protein product, partial [Rotaria magnacalcarata]
YKRLRGPTRRKRKHWINQFQSLQFSPISEPSTNPDTEIPRVEHASKKRANTKIMYDGQNPNIS